MILVTGASGLLGASVISRIREQGLEVTGLCHTHILKVPEVSMLSVDLTHYSETRQFIMGLRPTGIIHCAAATNVDWCEDHPDEAEMLNGRVAGDLAAIATELDARFVHVSTDAVFDGKVGDYSEEDGPSPINVYAQSKLHGERQVRERNPRAAIARVTIYGWNAQNKLSLAEWILQKLGEDVQFPGFTDVYFTPILATDLADCLLRILGNDLSGIYHIAGSERISKYHFARLIAEAFGLDPERIGPVKLLEAGLRARRPQDTSLNTGKICAALQCALPDANTGVQRFREQRENGFAHRLKSYRTGEVQ